MSSYLVTGGGGFIGSHLLEELVNRGENVRVLDDFSTGRRENIQPFLDKIEFIEGDIRSYHIVRQAVEGIDFIMHQAALPSVPKSIEDPITTNEVNVVGTLNVLYAARDAGVKRVVFASSSSIYGNSENLPNREDNPASPLSPYANSKLSAENYCRIFTDIYRLETVCLRYFNVFGPRQNHDLQYPAVVPKFIKAMLKGEQPIIYGNGLQSRDFVFVKDVVKANLLACNANSVAGHVFNIASGEAHTVIELVQELNSILETKIQPVFIKSTKGDIMRSVADISRAKERLGYNISIDFKTGLRMTV